eukprot:112755-Pyramimonas_sp.AAC.2
MESILYCQDRGDRRHSTSPTRVNKRGLPTETAPREIEEVGEVVDATTSPLQRNDGVGSEKGRE